MIAKLFRPVLVAYLALHVGARLSCPLVGQPSSIRTFAAGTWVENLVVRRNGRVLITTLFPSANVYEIDPYKGSTQLVTTVPNVTGITGIVESDAEPDVFYFNGVDFDGQTFLGQKGSCGLWALDLRGNGDLPRPAQLVLPVPAAVNLNGLASFGNGIFLDADWQGGTVFRLDINAGTAEVVLDDKWTRPPAGGLAGAGGVNGMKIKDDWLYFTTDSQDALLKVRLDATGRPAGKIEELVAGPATDDLWVDRMGGVFMVDGQSDIAYLPPWGTTARVLVSGLASPTACALGRTERERAILYVTTGGYYAYTGKNATGEIGLIAVDVASLYQE